MMKEGYFSFSVERNIIGENNMKKEKVPSMIVVGLWWSTYVVRIKLRMDYGHLFLQYLSFFNELTTYLRSSYC